MKLYVIRHGDPDYKNDNLTPLGRRQAEALAHRLVNCGIDEIYSSPLGRAQATAQPTAELLKKEIKILPWTSENTTAEHLFVTDKETGKRRWCMAQQNTNYKNNDTIRLFDNWQDAHPDFGSELVTEQIKYIADSSDEFLKEYGYERDGCIYKITEPSDKNIAVFCHAGFGTTWMAHLMQIPPHIIWSTFEFSPGTFSVFEFKNNENGITTPFCLTFCDTSHYHEARLPIQY